MILNAKNWVINPTIYPRYNSFTVCAFKKSLLVPTTPANNITMIKRKSMLSSTVEAGDILKLSPEYSNLYFSIRNKLITEPIPIVCKLILMKLLIKKADITAKEAPSIIAAKSNGNSVEFL